VQVRLDRHLGWIAAGIGLAAGAALLLTGSGSRRQPRTRVLFGKTVCFFEVN
jgi:hypothetical protein